MKPDRIWWVVIGLFAVMVAIVVGMVATLEPSRGTLPVREETPAPKKEDRSPQVADSRENDLSFEKMLDSAKETYFSVSRKDEGEKLQTRAYAREQAARAQSLARTKDQRFRVLFLTSVLAEEGERAQKLPENGQKLLELAESDAQKGRAYFIIAEGCKATQKNKEALAAYQKSAALLLGDKVTSKTDRVFGVWQLGHAADVVHSRLKEKERAEAMYKEALRRLDAEQSSPGLDGPIREAILLNMTSMYVKDGEPLPGYEELHQRQQEVMMAIKKFHPERTSAYISEQWERIKLNKI